MFHSMIVEWEENSSKSTDFLVFEIDIIYDGGLITHLVSLLLDFIG